MQTPRADMRTPSPSMKPPPPAHPDDATDTADTTVTTDTTLLDALRATLLARARQLAGLPAAEALLGLPSFERRLQVRLLRAGLRAGALPLDAPALVRVFIAALLGEAWRHELTAAPAAGRTGGDATAGDDALATVISILAAAGRNASLDDADNGDGGLACDSEGGPA